MSTEHPVIIVGAGVSGLTLAQACRKKHIPFRIFERDDSAVHSQHRTVGMGLTDCFGLEKLKAALPDELVARLPECHLDRAALKFGEGGKYEILNLNTAKLHRTTPTSVRTRLSREKLRRLLLTDIEVQWSKTLTEISVADESVKATFSDDTSETGSILIGCDGANSIVNRILHPQSHESEEEIPNRVLGATISYSASQVSAIRKLDPFFLRCIDPKTDVLLFLTFLENPRGDSDADAVQKCRLVMSWPYRSNWLDRVDPTDCPNTKTGQMALLKHLAESWAEPFRSFVLNMPRDTDIHRLEIGDGFFDRSPGFGGRVTLAGEAANLLIASLGEAAEHSITDINWLLEKLLEPLHQADGKFDFEDARGIYEGGLMEHAMFDAMDLFIEAQPDP